MAFEIENTGGNVNAKQNVKDSEVDKATLDFKVKDTKGDVTAEQNIEGVKSSRGWVMVAIALITSAVTIASYIFSPQINDTIDEFVQGEDIEYMEEDMPEEEQQNDLPIWLIPLLTGGFVIGKKLYTNYKNKKNEN